MNELTSSIAALLGISVAEVETHIASRMQAAQRRAQIKNQRYAAAMRHVTGTQAVVLDALERQGYTMQEKLWQDRSTQNVALMLTKECWDSKKGCLGRKLTMLYPDGARTETFERRISIKRSF